MNSVARALIRRGASAGVGALVAVLAAWGLHVPSVGVTAAVAGGTALASTGYDTAVHLLERRWPKLGHLLGVKANPPAAPPQPQQGAP